jgi:hypothetical protein
MKQPDGAEWNDAWASMPIRAVADVSNLRLPFDTNLGKPLSATVSQVPIKYIEYLYMPTEICPLCSDSTPGTERLPASVNLEFDQVRGNIGFCAWVHRDCFSKLEPSDKPRPIPW